MRKNAYLILIVGSFLLSSPCSAWAEKWVYAASAQSNGVKAYVDVDSIRPYGARRVFWMYHHFMGIQSVDGKPIEKAYGHDSINCNTRTIVYLELVLEYTDGSREETALKPHRYPIARGSVDEGIMEFVCGYENDKKMGRGASSKDFPLSTPPNAK